MRALNVYVPVLRSLESEGLCCRDRDRDLDLWPLQCDISWVFDSWWMSGTGGIDVTGVASVDSFLLQYLCLEAFERHLFVGSIEGNFLLFKKLLKSLSLEVKFGSGGFLVLLGGSWMVVDLDLDL